MPRRVIDVDGQQWEVTFSGRVTQYDRDEFSLVFTRIDGPERERRVCRYSPPGARYREESLRELSDQQLRNLLSTSQPSWTAPETGYRP